MDPRYTKLAEVLIGHSTRLQRGDRVLIDAFDAPAELVVTLIRAARARGALPFVQLQSAKVNRELLREGTDAQFEVQGEIDLHRIKKMQAYIAVRGTNNIFEASDVPSERMKRAHEAAAYDAWFREQVQASIDDSRPSLRDDQARTHMAARRQALLKKAGAKPAGKAAARTAR